MVSEIWVPQSLTQVLPLLTSLGLWASPYGANGHMTMAGHIYRPRQFHRTSNGENPSSGYRDMGSGSLAAARQPTRTVTTIPLQPGGLMGKLGRHIWVDEYIYTRCANVMLTNVWEWISFGVECGQGYNYVNDKNWWVPETQLTIPAYDFLFDLIHRGFIPLCYVQGIKPFPGPIGLIVSEIAIDLYKIVNGNRGITL